MEKKINKKHIIIGSCILAVCLFFIIFGIAYSCSIHKTEKYSITYVSEYGTKPENVAEATALPAELPTVADVEGWRFVGWYTTENFAEGSEATAGTALTANITLYAKWEAKQVPTPTEKYSITYVSEHGTKPEDVAEATALPAELPTVADVEGLHFVGWYTTENFAEGSEATAGAALTANITLYAKWIALDDFILSAKKEFEDYVNQKKSIYQAQYALDALDQVYTEHEHDFDELTTAVEASAKLQELKDMVDALTESEITITYIYEGEETITYAFGEEIEKEILVGEPDEKFVWLEENATNSFDFSKVSPNQSYTLYGTWHDIIKKINKFNRYNYFRDYTALPENNDLIEYTFDGDEISKDRGILAKGESNENRNIKITLPSKGRIGGHFLNYTDYEPIVFIDTSINITNTNSSYGTVTLDPASIWAHVGYSFVTLTSIELEAGTYYLNWTREIDISYIEIFYEVEEEMEFTRLIGDSNVQYRTGGYWGKVNLNYIYLETITGEQISLNCIVNYDPDHSLEYWKFIEEHLTIEVEDYEEFHEGHPEVGRTFDVTITFGKHTKLNFTIEIVEYWFM